MIVCPQDGQKLNGYVPGISQWQKAQVMFPQEPFRAFPVPTDRKRMTKAVESAKRTWDEDGGQ